MVETNKKRAAAWGTCGVVVATLSFMAGAHSRGGGAQPATAELHATSPSASAAPPPAASLLVTAAAAGAADADDDAGLAQAWAEFKLARGRHFHSASEERSRRANFRATLERLRGYEREGEDRGRALGLTDFADWSEDEKRARLGYVAPPAATAARARSEHAVWSAAGAAADDGTYMYSMDYWHGAEPAALDWRAAGVVTPVKNQGQCGSCWAFSATSQIETDWARAGNPLNTFAPQQVASCDSAGSGCGGGWPSSAYQYLFSGNATSGLMNAWAWPYTQSMLPVHTCLSSSCTAPCGAHDLAQLVTHTFAVGPYAEVDGWGYAIADCDDACDDQDLPGLMSFVQTHGPASICVNAERWFDYTGGVLSSGACGGHASGDLDHCVQVVGYNSSAADPYWIVRNQWDTVWGDEGYIYLEMSSNNTCGIANMATHALVNAPGPPGFKNHTNLDVPLN